MTEGTSDRPLASEGLLLAGATFAGYALAFVYEAGYLGHFGVPLDLVSLDVTKILAVTGGLLGLAWTLLAVFNPLSTAFMSERLPEPLRERLRYLIVPAVLTVVFLYLYGLRWSWLIPVLVVAALVLSVEFLLPLVTQRRTRGYFAKLVAHNAEGNRRQAPPSPLLGSIVRALGPQRFLLLLWLGFAVYVAYVMGQASGTSREWFYCPSASRDVVVVRVYGSSVVGARYDPLSHRLVGELVLGTRGEEPWTNLSWKRVGPLAQFAPGAVNARK